MNASGEVVALDGRTIICKPFPPQRLALRCMAFELLYGGSKGSMKTHFLAICMLEILEVAHRKWKETGIKQKRCRIIVFRKNLEDIKDFIAKTFELYPVFDPEMGPEGFHIKEKFWEFTSGATVEMRHLDGPTDHEGYQGNEFVAVLFDEVQYISYEAYSFLVAQVRSADPDYQKLLMVRCSANPGGPHGDWVKRHFHVDTCPRGGKIFEETVTLSNGKQHTLTRAFIRGFLRDNPAFSDGSYEANLRTHMSREQVRQYLEGDFDCVSGAFFAHLLRPELHFQKSKMLPATWDYIFGVDWGSDAPACCLWAARDPDGRVWIIDELHKPGITGRIYGEAMAEKYKYQKWSVDHIWRPEDFYGVIDKQAFDGYGGEGTAGAGIMQKGFRLFEAQKDPGQRRTGINQMKERLTLDRAGKPQVVVFEDRCPKLVAALKGILSEPNDVDDYAHDSPHSHAIDAYRFIHMNWTLGKEDERNPMDVEVERWLRMTAASRRTSDEGSISGYG